MAQNDPAVAGMAHKAIGAAADRHVAPFGLDAHPFGKEGVGRLDVVCPGFSADCLETLEEIAMQNAELFLESGGKSLHYIPALNARDDHIALLGTLVERHTSGWSNAAADPEAQARAIKAGAER